MDFPRPPHILLLVDDEERNPELAERLRQLRAVEALRQQLTHLLIHDLNGPLSALKVNLSILLAGLEEPLRPQQQAILTNALGNAEHLSRLIRTLLDIARLEEGRLPVKQEGRGSCFFVALPGAGEEADA